MRLYRALLHLYPASFRAEYGADLCALFALRRTQASNPLAVLALWLEAIADACSSALPAHWDILRHDVAWAARSLRRSPAFTLTAILVAALGIGAATAAFTLADHVLLRPLPYADSGRLVTIWEDQSTRGYSEMDPSPANYRDWKRLSHSFEGIEAYWTNAANLSQAGAPARLEIAAVTAGLLPMLGKQPAFGRGFTAEDDRPGAPGTVLLSDALWRSRFGGDPLVAGRTVILDSTPYTVIGVMPRDFYFPSRDTQVWMSARFAEDAFIDRTNNYLRVLARLRPGVTLESARAEMRTVAAAMERLWPKENAHVGATVITLREELSARSRMLLTALLGAALCVLLIGCTNLANLLLARGTGRRREMAIRAAVGAGRARLARQMLTESLLLTAIGGAAGMALAYAAVRVAPAIRAVDIPRLEEIAVDRQFLLIGVAVSLASGILFGVAPALQTWRGDLNRALGRAEVRGGSLAGQSFRNLLVAAQVALVMVLLSGAGLMTNTLVRLLRVDLGFARSNLFTVEPSVYTPQRRDRELGARYLRELAGRIRGMPGVASASVVNAAPLTLSEGGYPLRYNRGGVVFLVDALGRDIDPGYLRTAGIPLLAGRDFEPADASRKPVPVILNRNAATVLFGPEDPLGKVVMCADRRIGAMQVVAVVGDARVRGAARPPGPQAFAPLMGGWGYASVVVARAAVQPSALAPAIRAAVRELDPGSPPPKIAAVDDVFAEQVAEPRFYMALLDGFALLGLALAATGVYGVIAYSVARRTHEFGVRLALGARPGDIVRMVVGSGARVVAAGAVAGLAGALAATRLLSSLLFEVKPGDPATLAATLLLLVAIAVGSCWLAARRASRVDVNVALRGE